MNKIIVKKENGQKEFFDEQKLIQSLRLSGVKKQTEDNILKSIKEQIKEKEISSKKIYNISKKVLKNKESTKTILRYNLTQAISKLGPEGFAFEKFISLVFKAYNYSPVYVGKKIKGKCVMHELDVVAEKDNTLTTTELKFHNSRSKKSDLKVVLYMKARFDDILDSNFYGDKKPVQIIITNTKFTDNAKKYAKCANMKVYSWNYPEKNNLHDFILNSKVHPIGAIESISSKAQRYFTSKKIVAIQEIKKNNFSVLYENPYIQKAKIKIIKDEIESILKIDS